MQAMAQNSLALKIPAQPAPSASGSRAPHDVLCEGWLLKKRRKKLQGYARRYFVLRVSGLLSYSFEPGSEVRDQISLQRAAISSSPGRRDIHIDSGRVTFHIKCFTKQEFDIWMGSLRKFTAVGHEADRVATGRKSISRAAGQASAIHHATITLDEMEQTINDLTEALGSFDDEDRKSGRSVAITDRGRGPNGKHRDKETHSILSIFKKTPSSSSTSPRRASFGKDAHGDGTSLQPHQQMSMLLRKLREQHGMLSGSLSTLTSLQAHPRPPLQRSLDEDSATPTLRSSPLWQSLNTPNRSSMSTIKSGTDGSSSVFYDASEGDDEHMAEEYVVRDDHGGEESSSTGNSPHTESDSIADETEESEVEDGLAEDDTPLERPAPDADRRTRLPARPSGDEGSLFSVLKKNVGQDLANIAFPVTFNEPLTLLQRSAEELEYANLLDMAASTSDWVERICYVAAFAVSGYACTKYRSGRKGFTPLLGETFEEKRMNFVAEKVVHKPLIIACHAEGSGWELNATSSGKTKFWGKSFEIIPTGTSQVKIDEDSFAWNKPSSFTRNLMMGTKYLEHCGEMEVKNKSTGTRCVLDFKETGYWASAPNVVSGTVYSPDGHPVSRLEGKWDEQFSQKLDNNHLKVLWRVSPFPRDASEYYGYTYFAITLNEVTDDIRDKLPCTDSRFRPDVRALEEGDITRAENEKERLEQMQRERRERRQEVRPRWFKQVGGSDEWVYAGGYWEARKSGWKNTDLKPLW